jgi:hAT family protein
LYAAALILHPNCRRAYIDTNWPKEWVGPIMENVTKLWESYRDQSHQSHAPMMSSEKGKEKELTVFDQLREDLWKYTRPASQDEFQDYYTKDPYDIGKMTALEWWCQDHQRTRWPRLSCMALDVLSIPAMSDEPERVFSGARRTVSWDRAQMTAETLERVECLKHWKRSGILKEWISKE